jgi:hypothetical protein
MDVIKTVGKSIDIKDVSCENCMKFYRYHTPMYGFCTRYSKHSAECRNFCVKTQWYAEMCALNAAIDEQLK